jgi:hypothetical protein
MTSFMHVFSTNKVPQVVLAMGDKKGVTEPHRAGAAEPAGVADPAGVAGPTPHHDSGPGDYHFHERALDG